MAYKKNYEEGMLKEPNTLQPAGEQNCRTAISRIRLFTCWRSGYNFINAKNIPVDNILFSGVICCRLLTTIKKKLLLAFLYLYIAPLRGVGAVFLWMQKRRLELDTCSHAGALQF